MHVAADRRFRELAAAHDGARLYAWGARVLYLGAALGLTAHRNAVAVVAVALDAPLSVATDPDDPSAGHRRCRSVVIRPNTLHHLTDTTGRCAFLYVDARSRDLSVLWNLAKERTDRAAFDIQGEVDLVDCLSRLADGELAWKEARRLLEGILPRPCPGAIDQRVKRTLDRLHAAPGTRLAASALARDVGLSESRFLHLFKAALGVPFRRYKIWIAMGAAVRGIARGANLTDAALDAGFASSAHFSTTFREMFGLEPSRLGRGRLTIHDE